MIALPFVRRCRSLWRVVRTRRRWARNSSASWTPCTGSCGRRSGPSSTTAATGCSWACSRSSRCTRWGRCRAWPLAPRPRARRSRSMLARWTSSACMCMWASLCLLMGSSSPSRSSPTRSPRWVGSRVAFALRGRWDKGRSEVLVSFSCQLQFFFFFFYINYHKINII